MVNNLPKVSIVVPVYNMEEYLDMCVASVLGQTFDDFEIVFVNDGSTDRSEDIIDKYVSQYPNKCVKVNKTNGGLASARNKGLEYVKGSYTTFLDSDDYYDKDYLKKLYEKAVRDECDVVCSGQHKITKDGRILKTISYKIKNGKCLQLRLNISGKLYRTEFIQAMNLRFPEGKNYEDNSFNLQAIFLASNVGFLDYEGYYQVVHEGSITSKPIRYEELPFDEWERVAKRVHEFPNPKTDKELFDFTMISFLTYFLMVRNRKREYLSNTKQMKTNESVYSIAERIQEIVIENFEHFENNSYLSMMKNYEIPAYQKIGASVFYFFCKKRKVNTLVKVGYSLL